MRNLIFFLLFPLLLAGQVNFSTYGAVGDGVTNDRAALQSALDNESNLIADEGATFLITGILDIDQGFAHTIDWNGATIITTSALEPMIAIDKRSANGGLTTMSNLTIDGNGDAQRGLECNSRVDLLNIHATGFMQSTTASPAGIYIHVYNDADCYGDWIFDNVDVSDVRGLDNGNTTDSWGAANGYLIYWVQVPSSPTTLKIKNGEVYDCWGEDSQCVGAFSTGIDISNSNGSMEFTNMNMYDWERRCVKNFTGNATYTDCTFTDPSPSNPNLVSKNKSGMVVFGSGSGANGGDNVIFENCDFVGRGYDGRVIALNTTDSAIRNSTFTNASLAFTLDVGDFDVCDSDFGASSGSGASIYSYGSGSDVGQIQIDTNNTYSEGSPINVTDYSYVETALVCAASETCSDGIMNQDETGIDCGGVCEPCEEPEPEPSIGRRVKTKGKVYLNGSPVQIYIAE
tara:strand:+ start:12714 stop:14087 length:1374 start_codon:yes stop_codon:yes gene_type:complete